MTPVPKLASQALLVPFIMVVFVVIHSAGRILHWLGRRDRTSGPRQPRTAPSSDGGLSALDVKLASGFITTLLFMYQKIGTTTFVVLNCVPVDNVSALFIDGTVTCFTYYFRCKASGYLPSRDGVVVVQPAVVRPPRDTGRLCRRVLLSGNTRCWRTLPRA